MLNQVRRHDIPIQKRKVTNSLGAPLRSWRDYDASLRQRGDLTVWFTAEATEGWRAAPRATAGGQPCYPPLAILTALTSRTVFRSALREAEGLIGSIVALLGFTLRVPDHSTLSRRVASLEVPRPTRSSLGVNGEPMHLLVDRTGLKLYGAGEWLIEEHGAHTRRSWRMLHLGLDAEAGQIVASAFTDRDMDDASQVGPLPDQVAGAVACLWLTMRMTKAASTTTSPSAIQTRPWSCRHVPRGRRARRPRARRRGATVISRALSTRWAEAAMTRDQDGVLVVTPQR